MVETRCATLLSLLSMQGMYLDLEGVCFHACLVSIAVSSLLVTTEQTESAGTAAGSQIGRPDTLHCCLEACTVKHYSSAMGESQGTSASPNKGKLRSA